MTETTSSPTPPPLPPTALPKTLVQKLTPWVTIILGLIIGVLGLVKLYHAFVPQMPACDASETTDLIRSIFTKKDITLTALNGMKLVNETSDARNCQAHLETASETATIAYRITLQGKEFQVLITKVDAQPR
jgi:hypothetical protein